LHHMQTIRTGTGWPQRATPLEPTHVVPNKECPEVRNKNRDAIMRALA
jgi:hypothetical protein